MEPINDEIWRSVVGYEGLYEVSNHGRIYSLYKNKIMKQKLDKGRYCVIGLTKGSKQKVLKVHRLVARAFLDDFEKYNNRNYHGPLGRQTIKQIGQNQS